MPNMQGPKLRSQHIMVELIFKELANNKRTEKRQATAHRIGIVKSMLVFGWLSEWYGTSSEDELIHAISSCSATSFRMAPLGRHRAKLRAWISGNRIPKDWQIAKLDRICDGMPGLFECWDSVLWRLLQTRKTVPAASKDWLGEHEPHLLKVLSSGESRSHRTRLARPALLRLEAKSGHTQLAACISAFRLEARSSRADPALLIQIAVSILRIVAIMSLDRRRNRAANLLLSLIDDQVFDVPLQSVQQGLWMDPRSLDLKMIQDFVVGEVPEADASGRQRFLHEAFRGLHGRGVAALLGPCHLLPHEISQSGWATALTFFNKLDRHIEAKALALSPLHGRIGAIQMATERLRDQRPRIGNDGLAAAILHYIYPGRYAPDQFT